jgi:hypothetical protein
MCLLDPPSPAVFPGLAFPKRNALRVKIRVSYSYGEARVSRGYGPQRTLYAFLPQLWRPRVA